MRKTDTEQKLGIDPFENYSFNRIHDYLLQLQRRGVDDQGKSKLGNDPFVDSSGIVALLDERYGLNLSNHSLGLLVGKNTIVIQCTDFYHDPLKIIEIRRGKDIAIEKIHDRTHDKKSETPHPSRYGQKMTYKVRDKLGI